VLFGSQSRLPLAGPHLPSAEYFAACLFAGTTRRVDRETILENSLLKSGTHLRRVRSECGEGSAGGAHVFFSEQCWPVKQRSAVTVLSSQVGLTQLKLMFAEARPARAPRLIRDVLMVKDT
jgi:hypothetical protein